ncbi:MAG: aldo/keto reductase [Bifidobacteriaceae bacterium]|jgi:diketogulonate reductase-like aldo/keto reductase|nr:aldo/keto reductase [Bifidobacteriaceae bacterium]
MTTPTHIPWVTLNDGHRIPAVGFGSPDAPPDLAVKAFLAALDAGFRLIDTARCYGNEGVVGRAVAESDLPREEILIETKLPGLGHGYDEAKRAFDVSLRELKLDYVDLYLIHWPNPGVDKYVDAWRAMIELRDEGRAKSIGVSNFPRPFLERLRDETGVLPAVNQIERHIQWHNQATLETDAALGIVTESWSALAKGASLDNPIVVEVAAAHGVTPAQVVLRWNIQGGSVPLTYSRQPERIARSADLFSFELTADEMARLDTLEKGQLFDYDVYTYDQLTPIE